MFVVMLIIVNLILNVCSGTLLECLEAYNSTADVIFRGEENYNEINYQWNIRKLKCPLGYIRVKSSEDVRIALKCLKNKKLNFRIKCGGHSNEKYSYGNSKSFVIDLTHLNKIELKTETSTVVVGSGNNLFLISKHIWEHGKYGMPVGSCPTVGVSGFSLGGGFGFKSRKLGLLSDNIVEMEMVTADEKIIRVNNDEHSDLFWALRGGGGGNFGIVTNFHLKVFDASSTVITSIVNYKFDEFILVFTKWQEWAKTDPSSSVSSFFLYSASTEIITIEFVIQDNDVQNSIDILKSINVFFNEAGDHNNARFSSYFDSLYRGYEPNSTAKEMNYSKGKSLFVSKFLNNKEIKLFYRKLKEHNYVSLLIELCGGAVNAMLSNETAFCHRSSVFVVNYSFDIRANSTKDIQSIKNKGKRLEKKMKQFAKSIQFMSNGESYVNIMDSDEENALEKFYCNNLLDLKMVKRKYDPTNVFNFPLSIPLK